MKPDNSSKGSPLLTAAMAGLLCCALLGFAWSKSKVITQRQACRICAMEFEHKRLFTYGYVVRRWDTEVKASAETKNYFEPYLGYPHAHEWISKSSTYNIAGVRATFDPLLRRRIDMTRIGYQLVAASGIPDPERRRRYFESIIQPADEVHFLRVVNTWLDINRQFPQPPSGKLDISRIWGPQMEGIVVPDVVRAGGFMPYPPPPTPQTPPPDAAQPSR